MGTSNAVDKTTLELIENSASGPTGHGDSERFARPDRSRRKGVPQPMGKTSMLAALRGMGIGPDEMTPHAFRAMTRTLLGEVLGKRYDLIEMQLAHMVRHTKGRTYNRTMPLAERTRMMTRWASSLDELRLSVD